MRPSVTFRVRDTHCVSIPQISRREEVVEQNRDFEDIAQRPQQSIFEMIGSSRGIRIILAIEARNVPSVVKERTKKNLRHHVSGNDTFCDDRDGVHEKANLGGLFFPSPSSGGCGR